MNFNRPQRHDSGITVKVVSAVVFVTFCFLWLYFFQSDTLAVTQHVLSGGVTRYDRAVGGVLLTLLLSLLAVGSYAVARLRSRFFALAFFPPLLALVLLCNLQDVTASRTAMTVWVAVSAVLLALWFAAVSFLRRLLQYVSPRRCGLLSRSMWENMLLLVLMMGGVTAATNTNAVSHYRARMESRLLEHNTGGALSAGRESLESDASLTMLRAYALSLDGQLGDRLFQYAVAGRGADLVPSTADSRSRLLRYPQDSLYRHLGAIPRSGQSTARYLQALERSGQATAAVRDYVLCSLLVDRDLDGFVGAITRYYDVADSLPLPRHYREALTLYRHLRSQPRLVYRHAVTEEDYRNLQELEAKFSDPRERKIRVLEKYFGSYFYYYEYL